MDDTKFKMEPTQYHGNGTTGINSAMYTGAELSEAARNNLVDQIAKVIAPYERQGSLKMGQMRQSRRSIAPLRRLMETHDLTPDNICDLVEPVVDSQDHLVDDWNKPLRIAGAPSEYPEAESPVNKAVLAFWGQNKSYMHGIESRETVTDLRLTAQLVARKYGWSDIDPLVKIMELNSDF